MIQRPKLPIRSAFTLLEVIIAMTLASTLMLIMWSLFSTYTKLEERSTRTAIELQLVRSVSQQLRSDLEHFAVLPTPANVVSRSGLQSNSTEATDQSNEKSEDESEDSSEVSQTGADDEQPVIEEPVVEEPVVEDATDATATLQGPATDMSISSDTNFNDADIYRTTFNATLPDQTYLRGNATRLEFVTRLPYTVDVPVGRQLLGAETRYGTHQLVLYEWRDARKIATLLRDDPVLNPSKWNPPTPLNPNDPPHLATPLNPNENVGLVREMKSWLHVTRDRRMEKLKIQAEAAGLLVDGELPSPDPRLADRPSTEQSELQSSQSLRGFDDGMQAQQQLWHPPPEFRHKKDHIPEVTRLQFRYFTGEAWVLEWNQEGQLPRAVEVAFDLDPDAPAVRSKEFEKVHALMLGGQSLNQVLPPEELNEKDEMLEDLDPLATLNIEDPTAILTEYRFVVLLPTSPEISDKRGRGRENQLERALGGVGTDATAGSGAREGIPR